MVFLWNRWIPCGEQRRDHFDDAVLVTLWFLDYTEVSGICNLGTGQSRSFNEVTRVIIKHHGAGEIEYVPFPKHLRGRCQSYAQTDISRLREAGCPVEFRGIDVGIPEYLAWLQNQAGYCSDLRRCDS